MWRSQLPNGDKQPHEGTIGARGEGRGAQLSIANWMWVHNAHGHHPQHTPGCLCPSKTGTQANMHGTYDVDGSQLA